MDTTEQTSLLEQSRLGEMNRHETERLNRQYLTIDEQKLGEVFVGERLPYPDYSSIDFLGDLVKESSRARSVHSQSGLRHKFLGLLDDASDWVAVSIIGVLTACVAFLVDIAQAAVSDWKFGYCSSDMFLSREWCCKVRTPLASTHHSFDSASAPTCDAFVPWSNAFNSSMAMYVAFALLFGVVSASVTMLTKRSLPIASQNSRKQSEAVSGKVMFMAAGSGIPEIKTILSGFVIPGFLDLKVLIVKAIGAVFAVSTGMCLGKEGPFVHISTCVGYQVAKHFPKYRYNGRVMREMLSASCAAGLSVAFGAPIGGVLFAFEEISTFFPRRVLLRAFLCSLCAAVVLKALNPTGTGRLVLFETNYGTICEPLHYFVFAFLGVAGGIFGGLFCKFNLLWSRWFRQFWIIKSYPVLEAFLIVLVTTLLQYPSPIIRETGDAVIKDLFTDCKDGSADSWICRMEALGNDDWRYKGALVYGTLTKLVLTTITFGVKVPSGVIIPALSSGALFGRLMGQLIGNLSPGIFAMVGAAAFLAGVSRMTISLAVIMFELTGELEYVVPQMIAILIAKWVADAICKEGVYDVAQTVLGHPFLELESGIHVMERQGPFLVEELIPPQQTMEEITLTVPTDGKVSIAVLQNKLWQLQDRGLMDAGLVLINNSGVMQGYFAQGDLEIALIDAEKLHSVDANVKLFDDADERDIDISNFIDRTPLSISAKAPLEYAAEMFGKLGLRYLMIVADDGRLIGVIIRKRLVAFLDKIKHA